MKRRISLLVATAALIATLALPGVVAAHNFARVMLPNGDCIEVGAENEVFLGNDPSKKLDFDPIAAGDNFGASWAATRGNSKLEKGACLS